MLPCGQDTSSVIKNHYDTWRKELWRILGAVVSLKSWMMILRSLRGYPDGEGRVFIRSPTLLSPKTKSGSEVRDLGLRPNECLPLWEDKNSGT